MCFIPNIRLKLQTFLQEQTEECDVSSYTAIVGSSVVLIWVR